MRSRLTIFLAGLAIGAVGATLVAKHWADDKEVDGKGRTAILSASDELSTELSPPRTPPAAGQEVGRNESPNSARADDERLATTSTEASDYSNQSEPAIPAEQLVQSGERVTVRVSDAHKDVLARADGGGETATHEELEAQPEDDSWSYFMEQALAEFIAGHPNTDKFVISNIECRTTLCQIQAVGYDGSTSPDWSRILYDLRSQPWQDLEQVGSSSTSYQGQLAIVTHLRRRNADPAAP